MLVAPKDGAGIKMSGYSEDGMIPPGAVAPWMMPPEDARQQASYRGKFTVLFPPPSFFL